MTSFDTGVTRARRPIPERTRPRRGILGAFGQADWVHASPRGHPLGPGFDMPTDTPDEIPPSHGLDHDHIRDAQDLIEQHIRQDTSEPFFDGGGWNSMPDSGIMAGLTALLGNARAGDISDLAAQMMRSYSEIAGLWVETAAELRDILTSRAGTGPVPDRPEHAAAPAGPAPVVIVVSPSPVDVQIDMFRTSEIDRIKPLDPDRRDAAQITQVSVADGKIRICLSSEALPGLYHGLLLDAAGGPLGAVTLRVLEAAERVS